MVTTPQAEEPGFETDVNELPDDNKAPEDTLEDKPNGLEEAQKDGAEEREEGGLS